MPLSCTTEFRSPQSVPSLLPPKRYCTSCHPPSYNPSRAQEHLKGLEGTRQVPFGNVSLTVYAGHDIVSNNLAGWAHSWEKVEMREMLWALREYKVGLARGGREGEVWCL